MYFIKDIHLQLKKSAQIKIEAANQLDKSIVKAAEWIVESYRNKGKSIFCGNGGSAADAQHLAAEFVGKYLLERKSLPSLALTTNTSNLTAIGNDYGFEKVFVRQLEGWLNDNDILIGISTSGNSVNIIEAVSYARQRKIRTIGFLGGDGGELKKLVDLPIIVPAKETPRIQECHITIGHIICDLVEKTLFQGGYQ